MANEINKVESFNPLAYARHITGENEADLLYLDVQYRKLWFRLVYPQGKIVQTVHTFDNNTAVVEAKIYADKNDAENSFISNAFAQRSYNPNNDYSTRYLESAATAAVGRALADAGFGLQFCLEPDPIPVDMGQSVPSAQNYGKQTQAQYAEPACQTNSVPQQQQNRQPATPLNENSPIEEVVAKMPYEEAVKVIYHGNGKHNGKTLGQLAVEDFRAIEWIVNTYKGKNNLLKGAAIVIERKHKMA